MALDIIEIALDSLTDFSDFEKLATEVMQNEGYPDIVRLGGVSDGGKDGVVERFYEQHRRQRTIFQFTTQETLRSKLKETLDRLNGQEYSTLVLVTSRAVSVERREELERLARDEADVPLQIYDRKVIAARLSNLENGLFARHFPDIGQQLAAVERQGAQASPLSEEEILRAAVTFVTSDQSERARRGILRELVLAVLVHLGAPARSVDEVRIAFGELLPGLDAPQADQIRSALDWLVSKRLVARATGRYLPTTEAFQRSQASASREASGLAILTSDLADAVSSATGDSISDTERRLVERNVGEVLNEYFRLYGLEVGSQLLGKTETRRRQLGAHEHLIQAAQRDLSAQLGSVVLGALADLIARPNEEQADALTAMALGFLGAAVMQVDPYVRQMQRTRMEGKVFILDTDFLVDCIVQDRPQSAPSLAIVRDLLDLGARILVPTQCVSEAAAHASRMLSVLYYFGSNFSSLAAQQVEERVNNAFAQGFWYAQSVGRYRDARSYLANYYEDSSPLPFMAEVVRRTLPDGIEIGEVDALLGVSAPTSEIEALKDELRKLIKASPKSSYRDETEIESLASTDAHLYTAARTFGTTEGPGALGRSCYMITSSLRFIRAAERAFGAPDEISARPNTTAGLLRLIGLSSLSARDFVRLFDNPFLQEAVRSSWQEVEELIGLGVTLSSKSAARLAWDLETGVRERLKAVSEAEREADTDGGEEKVTAEYLTTMDFLQQRGFHRRPAVQEILGTVERTRLERDEALAAAATDLSDLAERYRDLQSRFEALEKEISFFGRKRQRYLRNVARGVRRPPRRDEPPRKGSS